MLLLLFACTADDPPPPEPPFESRLLDLGAMTRAFPSKQVADRKGWASDLRGVFDQHGIAPTVANTCSTVAVLAQESGFVPNPAVPGIGGMVDTWVADKQASMGKVEGWAFGTGLQAVLDTRPPGAKLSYSERLRAARTERDVDLVFREVVESYRQKLPKPLRVAESAVAMVGFDLDSLNPITTAGCMQVKVGYAEDHARGEGLDAGVRDQLYTREGCLHYGVVRLMEVEEPKPIYRFADYNAGPYSSRNAAFQEVLARLSGQALALDGDLLRYDKDGSPASTPSQTLTAALSLADLLVLSPGRVRKDLSREKEASFAQTETYTKVRELYLARFGAPPPDARLPDVHLESIKLKGDKTTAWFAESVNRRYQACVSGLRRS